MRVGTIGNVALEKVSELTSLQYAYRVARRASATLESTVKCGIISALLGWGTIAMAQESSEWTTVFEDKFDTTTSLWSWEALRGE